MKLLIDTNIILDVLLKREPFCQSGVNILTLAGREDIDEYVSASAITDIYYIAYKALKDKRAVRMLLSQILKIVSIAGVTEREIRRALELEWNDFEDSVQYSVALLDDMNGIVTRNPHDYKNSEIPVWLPEELLLKVKSGGL